MIMTNDPSIGDKEGALSTSQGYVARSYLARVIHPVAEAHRGNDTFSLASICEKLLLLLVSLSILLVWLIEDLWFHT